MCSISMEVDDVSCELWCVVLYICGSWRQLWIMMCSISREVDDNDMCLLVSVCVLSSCTDDCDRQKWILTSASRRDMTGIMMPFMLLHFMFFTCVLSLKLKFNFCCLNTLVLIKLPRTYHYPELFLPFNLRLSEWFHIAALSNGLSAIIFIWLNRGT